MKRNNSQTIHQQFFIQSLRNSINITKDIRDHQYIIKNTQKHVDQIHKNQPARSLSNSKGFKLSRKKSIGDIKLRQKNLLKCYLINDIVQINLNQIFILTNSSQINIKNINQHNKHDKNSLQLQNFKILIELKQNITSQQKQIYNNIYNNILQNKQKQLQIKQKKLEISLYQISIQDCSNNVKKTFPIQLKNYLENKNILQIFIKDNFGVKNVKFNGIQMVIEMVNSSKYINKQNQTYHFNPWQVIDKNSILLKNRISIDRPKSKIKWNCAPQVQMSSHRAQYTEKSDKHKSQIEENYGLKSYQSKLTNSIFSSSQKKQSTASLGSTIQEQSQSSTGKKSIICLNSKRKNNMISSFNLNQYKKSQQNLQKNIETSRSRSSFRNLKQKNDYFQMKESQRKKSLKKNLQQSVHNYQFKNNQLNFPHRSSQVKLQYGIK